MKKSVNIRSNWDGSSILLVPKLPTQMDSSVDGFLQSLGLEKYLITFQAEEVDMTALVHMTDDDLKALGIPMFLIIRIQRERSSQRSVTEATV
ncbi:hypothetical protein DKX38_003552 [Salix brachista]|uniref:SAM domain-containing protein n=1 Tax=Salix brachista TaxID=2182728 RepID=A0A5N5NRA1_9ROSI|nr:hypothetical protein DKX38_003552 [Salix brachista]